MMRCPDKYRKQQRLKQGKLEWQKQKKEKTKEEQKKEERKSKRIHLETKIEMENQIGEIV